MEWRLRGLGSGIAYVQLVGRIPVTSMVDFFRRATAEMAISVADPAAPASTDLYLSPETATRARIGSGSWLNLTLRVKGLILLAAVGAYLASVALAFSYERQQLRRVVSQFREVHKQEESFSRLSVLFARATTDAAFGERVRATNEFIIDLRDNIATVEATVPLLSEVYPGLLADLQGLAQDVQKNVSASLSGGSLGRARTTMYHIMLRLSDATHDVRGRRAALSEEYRKVNDRMSLIVIGATVFGVMVFGAIIIVFLGKLASDVREVKERALAVALGYRGPPLSVTRHDEVGGMRAAVNRMQLELRQREKQLEVSRQQRCHQEKMAAVGSLAAAVAHEINNPIEAISGMAQYMTQAQKTGHCPGSCRPQLILDQAQRIASITRNIAQLTAPRSPQPQLLDLNAIVRNTCGLVRYDKRFSGVDLTVDLAHHLRAVRAVPDHITQILMNVLINAADALVDMKDRKPAIRVRTSVASGEVVATVEDNGHGMTPEVLSQVFREYFTTKPVECGGGLGLFLCKVLIEESGGRIEIDSKVNVGTTVSLHFPLRLQQSSQA